MVLWFMGPGLSFCSNSHQLGHLELRKNKIQYQGSRCFLITTY